MPASHYSSSHFATSHWANHHFRVASVVPPDPGPEPGPPADHRQYNAGGGFRSRRIEREGLPDIELFFESNAICDDQDMIDLIQLFLEKLAP